MLVNHESPRYISGVVPDAIVVVSSSDYCGSVAVLIRCKVNEVVFINLLVIEKYQMSKIYLELTLPEF